MYTKTLFLLTYNNKSWISDADMIDFFILETFFKKFKRITETLLYNKSKNTTEILLKLF